MSEDFDAKDLFWLIEHNDMGVKEIKIIIKYLDIRTKHQLLALLKDVMKKELYKEISD